MMNPDWVDIGLVRDVPFRGSRIVSTGRGDVAIFKAFDGKVFALWDKCPHKGGPLSQGIVNGHSVTCPLHNWVVGLDTGEVKGPDKGCARKVELMIEDGRIHMAAATLKRQAA